MLPCSSLFALHPVPSLPAESSTSRGLAAPPLPLSQRSKDVEGGRVVPKYSSTAQEEIDIQRINASTVRQEAEREMAVVLEREAKVRERLQATCGETAQAKCERDVSRAECADLRRQLAELKHQTAEAQLQAATATAHVTAREVELKAALDSTTAEAEARAAEKVAAVTLETSTRVVAAEEKMVSSVERAAAAERRAAELQAQLARRESDLEEGVLASVRAAAEVRAAEGRAEAAERRFATERQEAGRVQLEWALEKEKHTNAAATIRVEAVEKQKTELERKLLKATSEAAAWRKTASDLEFELSKAVAAAEQAARAQQDAEEEAAAAKRSAEEGADARADDPRFEEADLRAGMSAQDDASTAATADLRMAWLDACIAADPAAPNDELPQGRAGEQISRELQVDEQQQAVEAKAATRPTTLSPRSCKSSSSPPALLRQVSYAKGFSKARRGSMVGSTSPARLPSSTYPSELAVERVAPGAADRPSFGKFLAAAGKPLATLLSPPNSPPKDAKPCWNKEPQPKTPRRREARTPPPPPKTIERSPGGGRTPRSRGSPSPTPRSGREVAVGAW